MFKGVIKKKHLNKVQKLSLVLIAFILLCTLLDVTTAWYINKDSVNNHFSGKNYYVNIMLTEPNWDSVGHTQAAAMQPGMDIFKDPRVVNIAGDDCYVRLQIQILDASGNEIDSSTDRYKAIRNAIKYFTGTDENGQDTFSDYNTDEFVYYNGYYYYTNGGSDVVELEGYKSTGALFTDVLIPTLKSDYAYFADGFTINVIAEAVYSVKNSMSIADCAARFDGTVIDEPNTASSGAAGIASYSIAPLDNESAEVFGPEVTEQPEESSEAEDNTAEPVQSDITEETDENDNSEITEGSEDTNITEDTEDSETTEDTKTTDETIDVENDEPIVVSTSSSGDFTDADSAEEVE